MGANGGGAVVQGNTLMMIVLVTLGEMFVFQIPSTP